MKHFYAAVAMLALSLCASATVYRSVAVHLTDGSQVKIDLTDNLTGMFTDEDLVITGGDTDVQVPRNQIKSFAFSEEQSGVQDIVGEDCAPVVSGGMMSFTNLPEGALVAVYDLNGKVLFSTTVSGSYSLDLSTIKVSPVIVTVNNVAYKIATK